MLSLCKKVLPKTPASKLPLRFQKKEKKKERKDSSSRTKYILYNAYINKSYVHVQIIYTHTSVYTQTLYTHCIYTPSLTTQHYFNCNTYLQLFKKRKGRKKFQMSRLLGHRVQKLKLKIFPNPVNHRLLCR